MEKLTLHRVLSELKTIDDRIKKATDGLELAAVLRGTRVYSDSMNSNSPKTETEFVENAKADFQSAKDLIKRKFALRSALMKTNSITKVTINGKEYTITEAIEMKDQIERMKALLIKMKKCQISATSLFHTVTEQADKDFERMLNAQISNLTNKSDIAKVRDDYSSVFYSQNKVTMIDPIGIDKSIKDLETEINEFIVNVDSALSEINATTVVEIE